MSRVQLALRVPDLEASVAFYTKLFGTGPAKLRDGYANFAIAEPPLKLVLIEGEDGEDTRMDHLGVEVDTTEAVHAATTRLAEAGLPTDTEDDTTCCYALQDKVWVHGPGQRTLGVLRRQGRRRLPGQAVGQHVLHHHFGHGHSVGDGERKHVRLLLNPGDGG